MAVLRGRPRWWNESKNPIVRLCREPTCAVGYGFLEGAGVKELGGVAPPSVQTFAHSHCFFRTTSAQIPTQFGVTQMAAGRGYQLNVVL